MLLKVGARAPRITLPDDRGRQIPVPETGLIMVVFIDPDCEATRAIAPALDVLSTSAERWHYSFYIITGGKVADFAAFKAKTRTVFNYLVDTESSRVRKSFGVKQTPTLFLIKDNKVSAVQEGWSRDEWQRQAQLVFSREVPDLSLVDGVPPFHVGTPVKK